MSGETTFEYDANGSLTTQTHGSTRLLTDAAGNVLQTSNYDAFGAALSFNAAAAPTIFLYGGDAVYDAASGLYLHGNGVRGRLGFFFVERDSYAGKTQDPLSLHKYLYVNASPLNGSDPSGRLLGILVGVSAATLAAGVIAQMVQSSGSLARMTGDQQALKELIDEATNGGREALSPEDFDTVVEWAMETKYSGFRAGFDDLFGLDSYGIPHWHFPGLRYKHMPLI